MNKSRKVVTILISLLAAILLWLYVVTVVAPEATIRVSGIPISLDGSIILEERGLIITEQNVSTLSLELSTSRANLPKLNADTIRINADASRIREPGEYTLSCNVTFPDTVRSSEVDIVRKSVDAVKINVARLDTRTVNIELNWTGDVENGYLFEAGSATMEPEAVVITGPKEDLQKIQEAVVSYDISNLRETVINSVPIKLLDAEGQELSLSEHTTVNVTQTKLTLPILRTRELQLGLELIEGGGVKKEHANVLLEPDTIRVKGSDEVIEQLDDVFILGSVDLASISNWEEKTYPLNLPAGVTNISGETEVSAKIQISGVETNNVFVSDIRIENLPDGYQAELSTRTVRVTIRGATAEIQKIKNNKNNGFYILVDLSEYSQTGAFTVPGRVMNPNYPDISVKENVEIGVMISQSETPPEE